MEMIIKYTTTKIIYKLLKRKINIKDLISLILDLQLVNNFEFYPHPKIRIN